MDEENKSAEVPEEQININTPPKTPLVSVKKIKPDLRKTEPPLVDVKVSNPVTYIKSWWKRIIGNEGLEIKIKFRPLTAIAITIIIVTVTLGLGRFVLPFKIPFFEYSDGATPTPIASTTPIPTQSYRQTGFVGELRYNQTTGRYYLITSSAEAISLVVPETVELIDLLGRRIFATGTFYPDTRNLDVESIEDMEVLPVEQEPVPTVSPSPEPTPEVTPSPEPTPSPVPES